jgi:hypothetical protein
VSPHRVIITKAPFRKEESTGILQVSFPLENFPLRELGTKELQSQFLREGNISLLYTGSKTSTWTGLFSPRPEATTNCTGVIDWIISAKHNSMEQVNFV